MYQLKVARRSTLAKSYDGPLTRAEEIELKRLLSKVWSEINPDYAPLDTDMDYRECLQKIAWEY